MESTLRLSIAHARANLRDTVQEEDIIFAKDMIMSFLGEISKDFLTGEIDYMVLETGKSQSEINIAEAISKIINDAKQPVEYGEIYSFFKEKIDEFKFQRIIGKMKKEGLIYEPKINYFKNL